MNRIVYRFLSKNELDNWLNDVREKISSPYNQDLLPQANGHKYIDGIKYVHFFKNIEDAPTILSVLDTTANHLCKFELDEKILCAYQSKGKYIVNDNDCIEIEEYAVPLNLVNSHSLKEFRITNEIKDVLYINEFTQWNSPTDNAIEL